MVSKSSEILYRNLGFIFESLANVAGDKNQNFFIDKIDLDDLIFLLSNRLPDEKIMATTKGEFILLANILDVDFELLDKKYGVAIQSISASDTFAFIYANWDQIKYIPSAYHLMCNVLYQMNTNIALPDYDLRWIRIYLDEKRIDNPAWIDLVDSSDSSRKPWALRREDNHLKSAILK